MLYNILSISGYVRNFIEYKYILNLRKILKTYRCLYITHLKDFVIYTKLVLTKVCY